MNAMTQIRKLALSLIFAVLPTLALAGQPEVVTSIKPVQGLVFAVLGDRGNPQLLLDPGTSPHAFSLKPSQAELLQSADIVFWMGPELETPLQGPLTALSSKAKVVSLLSVPGLDVLHINGALDPHVWLSIDNSLKMIEYIRQELTALEPDNAAIYAQNTKRASKKLKLLKRKAGEMVASIKDTPFMVQHDAFGYLTRDLGLNQVGYLQTVPGREPGAKHVAKVRDLIKSKGVKCLFVEPQLTSALADGLAKELGVYIGEIDAMGSDLESSPTLPLRIIQIIIVRLDKCLYTKPKTEKPL